MRRQNRISGSLCMSHPRKVALRWGEKPRDGRLWVAAGRDYQESRNASPSLPEQPGVWSSASSWRAWLRRSKARLLGAIQYLPTWLMFSRDFSRPPRPSYPGKQSHVIQESNREPRRSKTRDTPLALVLIQPSWLFSSRYAPASARRSTGRFSGFCSRLHKDTRAAISSGPSFSPFGGRRSGP